MKTYSLSLSLMLGAFCFAPLNAEECGEAPVVVAVKTTEDAPKRHPLKGVVVNVLAEKSALLVKHEEIPGVMKAMTMLLKVDANTLKSSAAKKDTAITGLLVRKSDGWWLEDVKVDSK